MILPIRIWPDAALLKTATPADVDHYVAGDYDQLIADLFETVAASPGGLGLAAPQVGVDLRIFVMSVKGNACTFVNPVIEDSVGPAIVPEGCLSMPGFVELLQRAHRVRVKSVGVGGVLVRRNFSGKEAQCVQHEVDHLDGKNIPDRSEMPEADRVRLAEWLELKVEGKLEGKFLGPRATQALKDKR